MNLRKVLIVPLTVMVVTMAACSPPEDDDEGTTTESGVDAATATSAEEFGSMDDLVAAAQAEGELNVIALPPDWANYGEML